MFLTMLSSLGVFQFGGLTCSAVILVQGQFILQVWILYSIKKTNWNRSTLFICLRVSFKRCRSFQPCSSLKSNIHMQFQ